MEQHLTREQVRKEAHPTSYRPRLSHQAPDVWVWNTTLPPKATFKRSDHKQHTAAGEKARVCKTEVQEVFTKPSTSSRPRHLPGPGTAGRVLCQTDRKTLLHSIPRRKTHERQWETITPQAPVSGQDPHNSWAPRRAPYRGEGHPDCGVELPSVQPQVQHEQYCRGQVTRLAEFQIPHLQESIQGKEQVSKNGQLLTIAKGRPEESRAYWKPRTKDCALRS